MTSSIPVEVLYAAGHTPVDLNNIFITNENPSGLIAQAEEEGFPRSVCAWIKGIFAVVKNDPLMDSVVAVTEGDCSNTHALMEVLSLWGKETFPFSYPLNRDKSELKLQIERLMRRFDVSWQEVEAAKTRLDAIRRNLVELDTLTWQENKVHGAENHLFLVSSSDFDSNPDVFEEKVNIFLRKARKRAPIREEVRLGFLGVPPVFTDFYEYVESIGARVVFNEVQRQFSMPNYSDGLVEQYIQYTYPYDVFGRIDDIREAVRKRRIDGLIHYTQSFCHRQIQDLVLRRKLSAPILTLEGEEPGPINNRVKIRIEAFVDMLR